MPRHTMLVNVCDFDGGVRRPRGPPVELLAIAVIAASIKQCRTGTMSIVLSDDGHLKNLLEI